MVIFHKHETASVPLSFLTLLPFLSTFTVNRLGPHRIGPQEGIGMYICRILFVYVCEWVCVCEPSCIHSSVPQKQNRRQQKLSVREHMCILSEPLGHSPCTWTPIIPEVCRLCVCGMCTTHAESNRYDPVYTTASLGPEITLTVPVGSEKVNQAPTGSPSLVLDWVQSVTTSVENYKTTWSAQDFIRIQIRSEIICKWFEIGGL